MGSDPCGVLTHHTALLFCYYTWATTVALLEILKEKGILCYRKHKSKLIPQFMVILFEMMDREKHHKIKPSCKAILFFI